MCREIGGSLLTVTAGSSVSAVYSLCIQASSLRSCSSSPCPFLHPTPPARGEHRHHVLQPPTATAVHAGQHYGHVGGDAQIKTKELGRERDVSAGYLGFFLPCQPARVACQGWRKRSATTSATCIFACSNNPYQGGDLPGCSRVCADDTTAAVDIGTTHERIRRINAMSSFAEVGIWGF